MAAPKQAAEIGTVIAAHGRHYLVQIGAEK